MQQATWIPQEVKFRLGTRKRGPDAKATRERILRWLVGAGRRGLSHEELCDRMEMAGSLVSKAVSCLKRSGRIECFEGKGPDARWRLKR